MAKRFTDTTKWDDDWYLTLPPKMKCAWDYICDNCDGAGVLKVSFSLITFRIGEKVTKDDFQTHFGDRIVWISDDKIWVVGFIAFQYKTLSPKNHAHRGIMARIIRLAEGLPLTDPQMTLIRGWKESLLTLKEEDIGRGLDSSSSEEESEEKPSSKDFERVYALYPRHEGKSPGMKTCKAQIKTLADLESLNRAVSNYLAHLKRKGTKAEFILLWSTFMNQWRDWVDPNHGSSTNLTTSLSIVDILREKGGQP
jgi:hypothetical protein